MIIPGIFIFFMWLVKIVELLFDLDFTGFGIFPLTAKGLPGIIFSPFIHADFKHLFNNSLPLFFLSVALFYFYSEVALKVFIWTFFITGMLVWIAGRDAWHIGASGISLRTCLIPVLQRYHTQIFQADSIITCLSYFFMDQWCGAYFREYTRMFPGSHICWDSYQELCLLSYTGMRVRRGRCMSGWRMRKRRSESEGEDGMESGDQ